MRQLRETHRRVFLGLGATVLAGALFASGVLVAGAMDDGDDPAADGGGDGSSVDVGRLPVVGSAGWSPAPLTGYDTPADSQASAQVGAADMASRGSYPGWGGGCAVPIPGVLKDGKVDPSLAGFAATYLGAGFELTGVNVR